MVARKTTPTPAPNTPSKVPDPKPVYDCLEGDLVRAMWYADPGRGKTSHMLRLANFGPIEVLDPEKRLKRRALTRIGVNVDNITVAKVEQAYEPLLEYFGQLAADVEAGKKPLVGFCWDAVTESTRLLLMNSVDSAVAAELARGMERNAWQSEQENYGDVSEQMRRLLRAARDIPVHLGTTCLAKRDKDENGALKVTAALTPAVHRDMVAAMDVMVYCEVTEFKDGDEYMGLMRPTGKYDAKDAFGVFPRRLAMPTFTRIIRYVNEEMDVKNDALQAEAKARRTAGESADAKTATGEDVVEDHED